MFFALPSLCQTTFSGNNFSSSKNIDYFNDFSDGDLNGAQFEDDGKQNKKSYSIDRLDPTKGYMKDNILVVSWRWNCMKKDTPLNYMMRFCLYMKLNHPETYEKLEKENRDHFYNLSQSAKEFEKIINRGEDEDDITYN